MTTVEFTEPSRSRRRSGGRTRASLLGRTALCTVISLGVVTAFAPRPAKAGPDGGTVVQGSATIQSAGSHTEITQTTQSTLINWRDFSIGTAESVNFAQPNTDAVALNRVTSALPSDIQGQLTANGQVWIINPNGVMVGRDAVVNVGGLLATTAQITEDAYEAGNYTFSGAADGSQIINQGTINASEGSIVLVAPVVDNSGLLASNGGDVALGAGGGFTVDFEGDGLTRFAVDPAEGARLNVSGTITATGGAAYLVGAASDAVEDSVVSVGGRVEATRIEERGGVIVISGGDTGLTEVSGTVDASQETGAGGRIVVTGDRVAIRGSAVIDASGAADGGTVNIGGGFQGAAIASDVVAHRGAPAAAPLPTAKRVLVADGAQIAANAGTNGDGGRVILWADEAMGFFGSVSATGGSASGAGGFAEISGRIDLGFDGQVDLTAAFGPTGTVLLDPTNIVVANNDSPNGTDNQLNDNQILFGDPGGTLTVSNEAIEGRDADMLLQATNNITVSSTVDDSGGGTNDNALTLEAENDIIFSGNADLTLEGDLTMLAGDDVTIGGNSDIAVDGNLTITADGAVNGGASDGDGTITWGDTNSSIGADGNVLLDVGQAITVGETSAGGSFQLTADGAVTQSNAITVTGTTSVDAAGFNITLGDNDNAFGGAVSAAGINVTIDDDGALQLGDIDATGDFTAQTDTDITDSDAVAALAGIDVGGDATLTVGNGGDILLDDAVNDFAGAIDITNSDTNDVSLQDANTLTLDAFTVAGAATLTGTDVDLNGAISAAGGITLVNSGAGGITLADTAGAGFSIDVDDIGDDLTLDANGAITLDNIDFGDALTLIAGGGVDQIGAATVSGGLSIDATGQDVTLTEQANVLGSTIDVAGASISLVDDGTLTLGDIDATGNFSAQGDEGVVQAAAAGAGDGVDVGGNAVITTDAGAGENITLDSPFNTFGGTIDLTADDVTVEASTAITVAGLTAGDATLTAGGAIDSTGPVAVTGTLTANTDGDDVSFGDPANVIGTFAADTDPGDDGGEGNVTVRDSAALALGAIDANDLTVTAGGAITQSAAVSATGQATLTATGFDITLSNSSNDFGTVSADGATIDLEDANTVTLGDIDATGNLLVQAADSILDNDPTVIGAGIDVGTIAGSSTFTAGTGGSILLDAPGPAFAGVHDFGTAITVNVTGGGNLADLGLVDRNVLGLTASDITTTNSITLGASGNILDDFNLGGFTLTTDTFTLQSTTGNIALLNDSLLLPDIVGFLNVRSADLAAVVAPNIGLLASGQFIVDAAGFAGGNLTIGGGTGVTLRDTCPLCFVPSLNFSGDLAINSGSFVSIAKATNVAGDLSISAASSVTQTQALTVTGASNFDGTSVFLTLATNNFDANNSGDAITATATGAVNLVDGAGSVVLGAISAGSIDIDAPFGSISQTAGGLVMQVARLDAGTTVTLTEATNDFDFFSGMGTDVSVADLDSVELFDILATGSLSVTANDNITDFNGLSGISVTGTTSLTAGADGSGDNDITIDFATTNFGGAIDASGRNIALTDLNSIVLGDIDATGTLIVGAGDAVTQTAAVSAGDAVDVGGNATISTPGLAGDDITLASTLNAIGGTVSLTGEDVVFTNSGAISIDALTATSATLSAGGTIADNGVAVSVGGTLSANTDGFAITFDEAGNVIGTFAADTNIDNSGGDEADVTVRDSAALALGAIDANDVTVTAGGAVTTTGAIDARDVAIGAAGAVSFNGTVAARDLGVTAGGAVTQAAAIAATGVTTVSAAGFAVTLEHDANEFGGRVDVSGTAVSLDDDTSIELGDIDATVSLRVEADGDITDGPETFAGGDINSTGPTTLIAGGNITVDDQFNDFGGVVNAAGVNVSLSDDNDITLGDIDASGGLLVDADGAIADSGALIAGTGLNVSGTTTLIAGTTITLNDTVNTFGDSIAAAGSDISLENTGSIILGDIDATGNLTVLAGTFILDSGATVAGEGVDVGGDTTITAGNGFNILVDDAVNTFGGTFNASGANVSVNDTGALTLGDIDATVSLTAVSGGAIDDGAQGVAGADVNVTGATTLTASGGITLNDATNDFINGPVNASGVNVNLSDINNITLGDIDATGTLTVVAGTFILDGGAVAAGDGIDVAGTTTMTAGNGFNILVDDAVNDFGDVFNASGATISVSDAGSLTLGDIDAAFNLTAVAAGAIADSGATVAGTGVNVSGTTTLSAGTTVEMDDAVNAFGGAVNASGTDISLNDVNAIVLGAISATGTFDLTAGGSVTDAPGSAIVVAGDATITAQSGANFFDVRLDNPGLAVSAPNLEVPNSDAVLHDFASLVVDGEDILIRELNDITITATGHGDGIGDSTLGSYRVDVIAPLFGGSDEITHEIGISGGGSVVVDSGGSMIIGNVTANQDILLTTGENFTLPWTDVGGGQLKGGIPLSSANGDLWLVALDGGFFDPTLRDALLPGSASNPESAFLIPGGTVFDASTGNIAIIVENAFKVVVQDGDPNTNPPLPGAPDPLADTNAFVLNTARDGIALISVADGEIAVGSPIILEQILALGGAFNPFDAVGGLAGAGEIFIVPGNLALESRAAELATPIPPGLDPSIPRVSVFVENTSAAANAGEGTRVDGATFVGGFFERIGVFGSFNGIAGQTAASQGFITDGRTPRDTGDSGNPQNPFQLSDGAISIIQNTTGFILNAENTANGCIIGFQQSCQPIGRVILLMQIEDGQLLEFKFFDEDEEEDDPFSNRGDEEDWQ